MMAKKVVSDVIISPRREISAQIFNAPPPTIRQSKAGGRKRNHKLKTVLLLVAAAAAVVWLTGFLFASIKIEIKPKSVRLNIDKTLLLSKTPANQNELLYRSVTLNYTKENVFKATEKLSREIKAEGTVVIFNKGREPQVLVASTRLESPNGKIYRIPKTIVVPPQSSKNGEAAPGSKEVAIVADKAGPEHNSRLVDFTLPGLKGSPRFNLVFGRSKTEISGGSSGESVVVGKTDRDSGFAKLVAESKKESADLLLNKIPPTEFMIRPSLEYVVTKENTDPPVGNPATEFKLGLESQIRVAIASKRDLERALVGERPEISLFGKSYRIQNMEQLAFKISNYFFDAANFKLNLTGEAAVEYSPDHFDFQENIFKLKLYESASILETFPGIARAEVKRRPFWISPFVRWFIKSPDRIDIVFEKS